MAETSTLLLDTVREGAFVLNDIHVFHGKSSIISHLSCHIPRGTSVALMGPNGSGKTSLLRTLAGLHKKYSGTWGWSTNKALLRSSEFSSLKKDSQVRNPDVMRSITPIELSYLPQNHGLSSSFPITPRKVVAMGRWKPSRGGALSSIDQEKIHEALTLVGLSAYQDKPIGYLSGGQFQRMLFARMIVQDAQLLLLDEPFSGMDDATVEILLSALSLWHNQGKTLIVAQHDEEKAKKYFSHTLLLARRYHLWGSSADVLNTSNWRAAYHAMDTYI